MTFSGRHTVDHKMDYLIKVNGGQTLMNKFKKFNPSRKPLKAKKKGFINIYTHVFGTLDEYDFKYGKRNYNRVLDSGLGRKYEQMRSEPRTRRRSSLRTHRITGWRIVLWCRSIVVL